MPLPLVERTENEIAKIVKRRIEAVKEVKGYHKLSVHVTGKRIYVEVHVLLDNNLTFEEAHRIASKVESEVRSAVPSARTTVHTEPVGDSQENVWTLVKEVAEGAPGSRGVHDIHIQKLDGKLGVDLHLEVSANMTLKQAHNISDEVESKIREANPNIGEITVHIESATELIQREQTGVAGELESHILHLARDFPEIKNISGIEIRKVGESFHVVLHSVFDPDIEVTKAHEISTRLEHAIEKAYPNVTRIDIHEEPDVR